MARSNYQDRLARLRGEVGAMADMVLDRYEIAIDVLESGNQERAQRVIDGDQELNDWYLDIESECVELLALQQPIAGDLRFITASFKIVTDLERIGDLATNLAEYGRNSNGQLPETVDVASLASTAKAMAADAMDAYTTNDAQQAREVAARDDTLDEQCKRASESIVRELVTTRGEEISGRYSTTGTAGTAADTVPGVAEGGVDEGIEQISRVLLTIRDLERVGDHAVNICARTVYMLENDDTLIY